MKYYIKAKNTETGESMIMSIPVFTSKKKAQEWANSFDNTMKGIAESKVVKHGEK